MDSLQIDKLIDFISCDKIITDQKLNDDSLIELILYNPSVIDKKKSFLIYEKEYNRAIEEGLLTEQELKVFFIENKVWSVEKEIRIETIRNDITKITRGLLSLIFQKNKLNTAKLMLRKAEKELMNLIIEKNILLKNSAENYGLSQKQKYIISKIVYNENGEKFWKSVCDFENEQNISLINKLCSLFFEESRLNNKTIREIARSYQWKTIWCISKNSGNLFGESPIGWTENQVNLAYWSYIYDMVMESYERPSIDIIKDDDLLDSWLINQNDKIENKCKGSKVENAKNNKKGRQEVFVFADKDGATDVYELNDNLGRVKIKANQKLINLKGNIKDQNLPDSQVEMRELLTDQMKNKMGDIRKGK